jgi:hypothetical protein
MLGSEHALQVDDRAGSEALRFELAPETKRFFLA